MEVVQVMQSTPDLHPRFRRWHLYGPRSTKGTVYEGVVEGMKPVPKCWTSQGWICSSSAKIESNHMSKDMPKKEEEDE